MSVSVRTGARTRARLAALVAHRIGVRNAAASVPLAMADARDAGRLRAGDLLLLVAFGGGLTWASTIVRYEPAEAA